MRVGFIGYGSITRTVIDVLRDQMAGNFDTPGVLLKENGKSSQCRDAHFFHTLDELLDSAPDIIVECAGQDAVRQYAARVLSCGVSMVIISIGALADRALYDSLLRASKSGNSRIILPSGAIGGIDALAAAKYGGIRSVRYRSRKPPAAWRGSHADTVTDLDQIKTAELIFRGSAGSAATLFPKNSNVAATIALAGIGFDDTEVELIADPDAQANTHQIQVSGNDGDFEISLVGNPSPDNPKTSLLTAHSVAKTLINLGASIVI